MEMDIVTQYSLTRVWLSSEFTQYTDNKNSLKCMYIVFDYL